MRWAAILFATAVSAAAQCNYAFSPPEISVGPAAFSHTITVFASPNCGWSAQSQNPDWIQIILGGTGVGNGQFVVRLTENISPEIRVGRVTMPGATLLITQTGANCSYQLTPSAMRVSKNKGVSTFFITSRCSWTARSDTSWIQLSGLSSTGITTGNGNGAIVFEYDENTGPEPRGGTITLSNGTVFRLTQDGTNCDVSLPSPFLNIQPQGGTFSVDVSSSCIWNATPNVSWIRFTNGNSPIFFSGTGNQRITFSVTANPNSSQRTGTITIGQKTFSIVQGGGVCTFAVAPGFGRLPADGGLTTFNVNTPDGCTWTALPNFSWISVLPGSGTGPGTVSVTVLPNDTGGERSGVVTVGGTTYGVVQSADPLPVITQVVNSGSLEPVPVSPGQIVWIRGVRLGLSEDKNGGADDGSSFFRTEIAGVRVLFDGVPAPMLVAGPNLIRAVAPYALAGKVRTEVHVEYQGQSSNTVTLPVAAVSPGILTLNETGFGPALARTPDYKFSDVNNPLVSGSEAILYITGEGQTAPEGEDGKVIGSDLKKPLLPVRVYLNEQPLEVTYAGSAPGQVSGLMQINVKIPFDAAIGDAVPLKVFVGETAAQANVTVSVRRP